MKDKLYLYLFEKNPNENFFSRDVSYLFGIGSSVDGFILRTKCINKEEAIKEMISFFIKFPSNKITQFFKNKKFKKVIDYEKFIEE